MKRELVVLLHGLYMNTVIMTRFSRYLKKEGYLVSIIGYNSVNININKLFDDINNEIELHNPSHVHFIGHSLGGLLIREYLANNETNKPGRVITLGTPHQTASIAKRLQSLNLDFLLGNSKKHGLIRPMDDPSWEFKQELGTISGTRHIGVRSVFFPYEKDTITDGTVTLEESKLNGSTDTINIDVNHTALVYSRSVINFTVLFLRNGNFNASN
jgi:pimeloyl-ACP methyl ester carboxylesterase